MTSTTTRRLAAVALSASLIMGGCAADDDGGDARAAVTDQPRATHEVGGSSDDPLVQKAVDGYQGYVEEQVNGLVTDTTVFTDAVRAGDVAAAKAAYPTSRQRWERIEPIAALISDIDGQVDSRAGEGVEDTESPEVTGWHQLEYDLWVKGDVSGDRELADDLDRQLAKLQDGLPKLQVAPLAVAKGASELIEEVAEGKITGEEDRYSHTDLWDLVANVEGAKAATDLLRPAIAKADPELAAELDAAFAEADDALAPYREGEGWQSYEQVSDQDRDRLKAKFSALAEKLGDVPGALELS